MTLTVRGLKVRRGERWILDGIDLDVAAGEFVAITGPSGCGKSTLLNVLAGLLPITSGEIHVDRRSLGYVFQRPMLLPWRNVLDNAAYGLECHGESRTIARERAGDLLRKVGLGDFLRFSSQELSEGMKQRLNVARAFAIRPRLVLMDEPFSALDETARRELQDLVLHLWAEARCTVLFVSHSFEELVYLADRVVVLSERPAQVAKTFKVALGRPRGVGTEGLLELARAAQQCRVEKASWVGDASIVSQGPGDKVGT